MLILTRTAGQRLIITTPAGETIAIQIMDCRGNVKVGIDAPKDIVVDREEIHDRKVAEGTAAAPALASAMVRAVVDPRRDPTKRITRQEARSLGGVVANAIIPALTSQG